MFREPLQRPIQEDTRPLLDRTNLTAARPDLPNGESWRWDRWAQSGGERWQGGTLEGVQSKLAYLQGPVALNLLNTSFRQYVQADPTGRVVSVTGPKGSA